VEANANITANTATKITFDTKGLVVSGASLSASDIPDLSANYATAGSISNIVSTIATAYSNTSTYSYFDHVTYNNLLYYCNQPGGITTAEEWTAAHWTQITISSELFILDPDQSPTVGSILFRNSDNNRWRASDATSCFLRNDFCLGFNLGGTLSTNLRSNNLNEFAVFGESTGNQSIALGSNSKATGWFSIAIGGMATSRNIAIDSWAENNYCAINGQINRTSIGGLNGVMAHGKEVGAQCATTPVLPENIGILDVKNSTVSAKDKILVCRDNDTTTVDNVTTCVGTEVFSVLKDGALQSLYDETNKEATTAQTLAIISGRTYLYGSPARLTISSINGGADISSTLGRNEITILIDAAASGFTLTMTALTTGAMGLILPSGITHTSGVISGFTADSTYVITIKNKTLRIEVVSDFYDPEA